MAPESNAVAALLGYRMTCGAVAYAPLKVTVITVAAAVGNVPLVTLTIPDASLADASNVTALGAVPAPAPTAPVGAVPYPLKCFEMFVFVVKEPPAVVRLPAPPVVASVLDETTVSPVP